MLHLRTSISVVDNSTDVEIRFSAHNYTENCQRYRRAGNFTDAVIHCLHTNSEDITAYFAHSLILSSSSPCFGFVLERAFAQASAASHPVGLMRKRLEILHRQNLPREHEIAEDENIMRFRIRKLVRRNEKDPLSASSCRFSHTVSDSNADATSGLGRVLLPRAYYNFDGKSRWIPSFSETPITITLKSYCSFNSVVLVLKGPEPLFFKYVLHCIYSETFSIKKEEIEVFLALINAIRLNNHEKLTELLMPFVDDRSACSYPIERTAFTKERANGAADTLGTPLSAFQLYVASKEAFGAAANIMEATKPAMNTEQSSQPLDLSKRIRKDSEIASCYFRKISPQKEPSLTKDFDYLPLSTCTLHYSDAFRKYETIACYCTAFKPLVFPGIVGEDGLKFGDVKVEDLSSNGFCQPTEDLEEIRHGLSDFGRQTDAPELCKRKEFDDQADKSLPSSLFQLPVDVTDGFISSVPVEPNYSPDEAELVFGKSRKRSSFVFQRSSSEPFESSRVNAKKFRTGDEGRELLSGEEDHSLIPQKPKVREPEAYYASRQMYPFDEGNRTSTTLTSNSDKEPALLLKNSLEKLERNSFIEVCVVDQPFPRCESQGDVDGSTPSASTEGSTGNSETEPIKMEDCKVEPAELAEEPVFEPTYLEVPPGVTESEDGASAKTECSETRTEGPSPCGEEPSILVCCCCEVRFDDVEEVIPHMREVHLATDLRTAPCVDLCCPVQLLFCSREWETHVLHHIVKYSFACAICSYSTKTLIGITRHQLTHKVSQRRVLKPVRKTGRRRKAAYYLTQPCDSNYRRYKGWGEPPVIGTVGPRRSARTREGQQQVSSVGELGLEDVLGSCVVVKLGKGIWRRRREDPTSYQECFSLLTQSALFPGEVEGGGGEEGLRGRKKGELSWGKGGDIIRKAVQRSKTSSSPLSSLKQADIFPSPKRPRPTLSPYPKREDNPPALHQKRAETNPKSKRGCAEFHPKRINPIPQTKRMYSTPQPKRVDPIPSPKRVDAILHPKRTEPIPLPKRTIRTPHLKRLNTFTQRKLITPASLSKEEAKRVAEGCDAPMKEEETALRFSVGVKAPRGIRTKKVRLSQRKLRQRLLSCSFCAMVMSSKEGLTNHYFHFHRFTLPLSCPFEGCDDVLNDSSQLHSHVGSHTKAAGLFPASGSSASTPSVASCVIQSPRKKFVQEEDEKIRKLSN